MVASGERIACAIQATFQMLNRPSFVSSRPTDVSRVNVGAVIRATSAAPTSHARSAGPAERADADEAGGRFIRPPAATTRVSSARDCTKGPCAASFRKSR